MTNKEIKTINVEVILKNNSLINKDDETIKTRCYDFLKSKSICTGTVITNFYNADLYIHTHVKCIIVEHLSEFIDNIDFSQFKIQWFVYSLNTDSVQDEVEQDHEGENVQLATVRILPSNDFFNLWESLIYDVNIKEKLIKYASTALFFADRKVNSNINNCNRVVLLHGPPGTGKTSLCKALAHKLTVRLGHRFNKGILLEINSHSLFSKWFSESGKLVNKMFSKIQEYLLMPNVLIFVLIDEIESLTHAREQCMSGNEPSDSVRVVNAILTEIDKIKNYPNVLILTTSNMTTAIDLAFIDRVDITQFIGLPSVEAIHQIYSSCIEDLMKAEIITSKVVITPFYYSHLSKYTGSTGNSAFETTKKLFEISKLSEGFSGRQLRKIPLCAHTYLENQTATIEEFFKAMILAINNLKVDKNNINQFK